MKTNIINLIIFAVTIIVLMIMVSCNVTRKVITTSEVHRNGDSTIIIESRTTETYNAVKK